MCLCPDWFLLSTVSFFSSLGACWCPWYGPTSLSHRDIFTPVFVLALRSQSLRCVKLPSIKVSVLIKQLSAPVGVTGCGDGPSPIWLGVATRWLSLPSPLTKRYSCRMPDDINVTFFFVLKLFLNRLIVSVVVVCFCSGRLPPQGTRGRHCAHARGSPDLRIPVHVRCQRLWDEEGGKWCFPFSDSWCCLSAVSRQQPDQQQQNHRGVCSRFPAPADLSGQSLEKGQFISLSTGSNCHCLRVSCTSFSYYPLSPNPVCLQSAATRIYSF